MRGTDAAAGKRHYTASDARPANMTRPCGPAANWWRSPMSQLFTRDERLILVDPADGPLLRKVTQWDRLAAIFGDPDLIVVVLFCALGALLTIVLIHSLPGWVEAAATAQQFF
jgi:hypothetical protein